MTIQRLAKLRQSSTVRGLLSETRLHTDNFITPIFINAGIKQSIDIPSMPGYQQLALNDLAKEAEHLLSLGLKAVILFGIPSHKDAEGSSSWQENGVIQQACRFLKQNYPELLIIADLCFCEYTDHGHCGLLHRGLINQGQINHDATLPLLNKQAISLAQAGVDWLAPSGMIDGMIGSLRHALDTNGYENTALLSYAVKYQSNLYGPFREAAEGAPQFGDRSTYQMNIANAYEALREVEIDVREGADLIMVKPAMLYQDIILRIKQQYPQIPLCAYQVSGEYAMIKQAGYHKIANENQLMIESLTALKRSGADLIISYFAKAWAHYYKHGCK